MGKAEWIKCEDSLPKEYTPVLIVREAPYLKEMYVAFLDCCGWCDNYSYRIISDNPTNPITHWTYLPELPKEE